MSQHMLRVVHRGVKPPNTLSTLMDIGDLKACISDFGLAATMPGEVSDSDSDTHPNLDVGPPYAEMAVGLR